MKHLIVFFILLLSSGAQAGVVQLRNCHRLEGELVRDEWNLQSEMDFRRSDFRHVVGTEYARSSWFYSAPQERCNTRYSLDWFLGDHWFWYNGALIGADPQRGTAKYKSLGAGAGYYFFEASTSALSLKTGLAYMDERYLFPINLIDDFTLEDSFMALALPLISVTTCLGVLVFFHNNETLQSTEDEPNWRVKTTTRLSSMILERIYSEFKIDIWLDNEPQPARKGKDTHMSLGVSYKW